GDDCLFGDGNVAGAGGDDGNGPFTVLLRIALQNDGAREFAILDAADFLFYGRELFSVGAGGENIAAMFGEARENLRDLHWCFTFTENNLRHACAQGAMMIDLGEAEIFKRQMAQAGDAFIGRELAPADIVK